MNQIIDEAYKNYENKIKLQNNWEVTLRVMDINTIGQQELLSQEEFINKCKTDSEFSEKWGLKIEERELSLEERNYSLGQGKAYKAIFGRSGKNDLEYKELFDRENRPNKLITITYNNETIEVFH